MKIKEIYLGDIIGPSGAISVGTILVKAPSGGYIELDRVPWNGQIKSSDLMQEGSFGERKNAVTNLREIALEDVFSPAEVPVSVSKVKRLVRQANKEKRDPYYNDPYYDR